MKPVNLEYYLQKLNLPQLSIASLSIEEQINYLHLIYSAHVKTFPYSNFALRRIARQHLLERQALTFFDNKPLTSSASDGYCFQSAVLMADSLKQLGYNIQFCAARILVGAEINAPEVLAIPPTHLILLVIINEQRYLLDPGLGSSAPRAPILISGLDESILQDQDEFKFHYSDHSLYILEKKTSQGWFRLMQTDLKAISEETVEFNLLKLERHPSVISIRDTKTVVGIITESGRKTLLWDEQSNQLKFSRSEGKETLQQVLESFEEGHEILKNEFGINHVSSDVLKTFCTATVLPKPKKPWTIDFPIDDNELNRMKSNLTL